jgi:hypothetical protein
MQGDSAPEGGERAGQQAQLEESHNWELNRIECVPEARLLRDNCMSGTWGTHWLKNWS